MEITEFQFRTVRCTYLSGWVGVEVGYKSLQCVEAIFYVISALLLGVQVSAARLAGTPCARGASAGRRRRGKGLVRRHHITPDRRSLRPPERGPSGIRRTTAFLAIQLIQALS